VLVLVARPLSAPKGALLGGIAGAAALIWTLPLTRRTFTLEWPPTAALWAAAAIVFVAMPVLGIGVRTGSRLAERPPIRRPERPGPR
jgi:hypothetical protein